MFSMQERTPLNRLKRTTNKMRKLEGSKHILGLETEFMSLWTEALDAWFKVGQFHHVSPKKEQTLNKDEDIKCYSPENCRVFFYLGTEAYVVLKVFNFDPDLISYNVSAQFLLVCFTIMTGALRMTWELAWLATPLKDNLLPGERKQEVHPQN